MKTLHKYLQRFSSEQAAEMRRVLEENSIDFSTMTDDDLEDLELVTTPGFIPAMTKLVDAIENTDLDINKVEPMYK